MNFKSVPLLIGLSLISSLLLAQPTMITELKAGDSQLTTNYTKNVVETTTEYSYFDFYGSSQQQSEESFNAHLFSTNLITVSDLGYPLKPTLGFEINRVSSANQKAIIKHFTLGALFDLEELRQGFFGITYAKSDKQYLARDAIKGQLSFELNEIDSIFKNELSLNALYKRKYLSITGGHEFSVSNKTKLLLGTKFDLFFDIGTSFTTKEKSNDFDVDEKESYESIFSYGGGVNIHPSRSLTLQFSILNIEKEFDKNNSTTYKNSISESETRTTIAMVSRF